MIAYFSFQPGMGGHFFLRLLLWRFGLVDKPVSNSYWNEYHFPETLWQLPDFSRLQINLEYGEEWPKLGQYDPVILEQYLETFNIPKDKNCFILDHQIFPNLNESMKKVKGVVCPTIAITTKNIDTAYFCRNLRDVKSLMKDYFGLRDNKNMNVREKPIWYTDGPAPVELGAKKLLSIPQKQKLEIRKWIDLEVKHADIILDYDKLIVGDISCFKEIDSYYKLEPVIEDEDVINCIKWYNVENKKLIKSVDNLG
tara:strand:+ start:948 stop:1709 length:762 start_codon:yes stop_codon:yes gene_type:complete